MLKSDVTTATTLTSQVTNKGFNLSTFTNHAFVFCDVMFSVSMRQQLHLLGLLVVGGGYM